MTPGGDTMKSLAKKNIPLEDIISLHEQGLYDREIAEILGCTRHNICQRLNRAGYTNRKSKINDIALRNRISDTLKGRYVGELNPNYKGYHSEKQIARGLFKTMSHEMIRNSGYRCKICKNKSQTYHTHHIKPFSLIFFEFIKEVYSGNIDTFVEEILRYDEFTDKKNLIVICESCHHDIHYSDNPELSPYRYGKAQRLSKTL